jgi:plasmid stabilization system protein ParE
MPRNPGCERSMAFRVEIAPQAFRDIDEIAGYITEHGSFESAQNWFNRLLDDIWSLQEMPGRCSLAEESRAVGSEIRVLLHGSRNRRYRVYFAIRERSKTVQVFHVRHWARKPAEADELEDLMDEQG